MASRSFVELFACYDLISRVLGNEQWLRNRTDRVPWQHGLVPLTHVNDVFPTSSSTQSGRTISRPESLPGLELLCNARANAITIQPSTSAFKEAFERMSMGLLHGLDWSNVFVAGGVALGTLLSVGDPPSEEIQKLWHSSDIDVYIYGLSADEATDKVQHIYETLRSNRSHSATLAVKNSKTITFYAQYPFRRIQVVLKLVESPKDVLLNFDVDICAMGWDGKELWMLPRAARALETGCNVFTMNLIRGHYLSERRASQPKRLFKYANKGYGIRILPSYLLSLNRSPEEVNAAFHDENLSTLDITDLASDARTWTKAAFERAAGDHRIRYSDMDNHPTRRSCLTSFVLFMRYVAYWELRQRTNFDGETAAYESYEDTVGIRLQYERVNRYKWDSSFNLPAFKLHIDKSNASDFKNWARTDIMGTLLVHGVEHGDELEGIQRMAYASHLEVLLDSSHDIKIPVLLPCDFAAYANALVGGIQAEAQMERTPLLRPVIQYTSTGGPSDPRSGLYIWRITAKLMWQQQDRRLDELFDVLQAFCRANIPINPESQAQRFAEEMSKRILQRDNEWDAFFRWIKRPV
ncbi:hypothetical protein DFH06DRAFT_1001799 [Mycena polygramma]|nr:hypothetical protein DFH06DRAFT_1001799 [Mycena polygramma]